MTQNVYNLKNVRITLNTGVLLDCTEISIEEDVQLIDRTSGAALGEQTVINKAMRPKVTIAGFNSNNLAFADLKRGTKVSAFSVAPTATGDNLSFLRSDFLTDWPVSGLYLGKTNTSLDEGSSSKWTTELIFGVVGSFLATSS